MSSLDYDSNAESLAKSDLSEQQILGLVASRNHYGDVDLEHYRLNVMQALDIAEGKLDAATKPAPQRQLIDETEVKDEKDESTDDLESVIIDIISKLDQAMIVTDAMTMTGDPNARPINMHTQPHAATVGEPINSLTRPVHSLGLRNR